MIILAILISMCVQYEKPQFVSIVSARHLLRCISAHCHNYSYHSSQSSCDNTYKPFKYKILNSIENAVVRRKQTSLMIYCTAYQQPVNRKLLLNLHARQPRYTYHYRNTYMRMDEIIFLFNIGKMRKHLYNSSYQSQTVNCAGKSPVSVLWLQLYHE